MKNVITKYEVKNIMNTEGVGEGCKLFLWPIKYKSILQGFFAEMLAKITPTSYLLKECHFQARMRTRKNAENFAYLSVYCLCFYIFSLL